MFVYRPTIPINFQHSNMSLVMIGILGRSGKIPESFALD